MKRPATPSVIPPSALLLSAACLLLPLVAVVAAPEWVDGAGAVVIWVPALIPAFLMAYHRGWVGASQVLAVGLAALALSQVEILLLDLEPPPWEAISGVVLLLIVTTVGSGWLAGVLGREARAAERMALTDPLTRIANRRHAMVFLDAVWAAARRGSSVSAVLFDLDHFKSIHDTHGHSTGDRVLRSFGEVLADRTRSMDLSARVGEEEFLSILVDCEIEDALLFAEEVRGELAETEHPWGRVTASAGVAAYSDGMGTPDVLLAAADRALHAAKDAGRNRVERADRLGTTVPAARARRRRAENEDPASTERASLEEVTVLVVDDDPGLLRATRRTLEGMGCRVEPCTNPFEAVDRVQNGGVLPHVLVTDVVMPEMSGFALVDMLGRLVSGLPVLYVSGYDQQDMYWSGAPGARSAILGKPFTPAELERALLELLELADPAVSDPRPAAHTQRSTAALGEREEAGADAVPERAPERAPEEGRLLVVDDDATIVRALERIFEREGYRRVETTTDPREAVRIARDREPDLVLLDIHMPGLDGFGVMRELQEMVGDEAYLPVIFLSGDEDRNVRQRALELGATDFLRKPLDVAETLARVRTALTTRFLHRRVLRDRAELERRVRERTRELADTRTEILHRLARAAEYRDDVTGRHAARVGLLSSLIAAELGLSAEDRELIRRTAPLHDIGKIGVPDRILHKRGPLTETEFTVIKKHTVIGARILEGGRHRILRMARDIAESHHERWDGTGYPHGRAGSDIPIEARIVAAADTFDVLTHARPYKAAKTPAEAVEEIVRCRGAHFDPRVSDSVLSICERVGSDALPALVDPIDPWQDTEAVEAARA